MAHVGASFHSLVPVEIRYCDMHLQFNQSVLFKTINTAAINIVT